MIAKKIHGTRAADQAGIAVINAIAELLASPAEHPHHTDIPEPDKTDSVDLVAD